MDSLIALVLVFIGILCERTDLLVIAALFSLIATIHGFQDITIRHLHFYKKDEDIAVKSPPEKNWGDKNE